MIGVYLFALALGGPVLAWILFAGLEGGADASGHFGDLGSGDLGSGNLGDLGSADMGDLGSGHVGDHGVHGDGVLSFLSLSSIAFVLTFFGVTGLVSEGLGASTVLAFVLAVVIGFGTGTLNSAAFRWIRHNSTSSDVSNRDLEGSIANVLLPVDSRHRGRIAVTIAGAREQMTAEPADGSSMAVGEQVVIVAVSNGVALVASLDPALGAGHDTDQLE